MASIDTKFYISPFASQGDKGTIPNVVQPNGSINYETGYSIKYTLDPTNDPTALDIERLQFNQLMYDVTKNIQQYQVYGVPNFITTAANNGTAFPYPKWAFALYDNGIDGLRVYQSLVDNNTTLPTDITKWAPCVPHVAAGFNLGLIANKPLTPNTDIPIIWDRVDENKGGYYNIATGEAIFPFKAKLNFSISGQIANADEYIRLLMSVYVNGNTVDKRVLNADNSTNVVTGTTCASSQAKDIVVEAGDVITFGTYMYSGSSTVRALSNDISETFVTCHVVYLID